MQLTFLLYLTHWLVQFLWRRGNDPDNFAIPYLTALGDVLGTGLLTLAFVLLSHVFGVDVNSAAAAAAASGAAAAAGE